MKIIIFVLLGYCSLSMASTYRYHPSVSLRLGGGFNPDQPDESTLDCVNYDGVKKLDTDGAARVKFTLSLVKSREDLHRHLKVSTKISAKYKFISGGGSSDLEKDIQFHSDSLTWIVLAHTEFGRERIINPRLNRIGLKYQRNKRQFTETCGKELVLERRKGAMVAAIYSVSNLSRSEFKKLKSSFSADGGFGKFSAKVSRKYESFYQYANSIGKVNIQFYAYGGEGISKLHHLANMSPFDLKNVQKTLADYIKGITLSNAMPIQYITGSFKDFGVLINDIESKLRDNYIKRQYLRYVKFENEISRLSIMLTDSNLSDSQYEEVSNLLSERENELLKINNSVNQCIQNEEKCSYQYGTRMRRINWSEYESLLDRCEELRMKAYENFLVDKKTYMFWKEFNKIPIFNRNSDPDSGIAAIGYCE